MSTQSTLQDTFEIDGYWWEFGKAESEQVHGTLNFSPDNGIRLETDGPLTDDEKPPLEPGFKLFPSGKEIPFIAGFTRYGEHIYLLDCLIAGKQLNFPGLAVHVYKAETLLISSHNLSWDTPDGPLFKSFQINLTHLEEWMSLSPIIQERGETENGEAWFQTRYVHTKNLLKITDLPGYVLSLSFAITAPTHLPLYNRIWQQTTYFDIEASEPKPLSWLRQRVFELRHLVAVLSGEAIYPREIKAFGDEIDGRLVTVQVFYAAPRSRWAEKLQDFSIILRGSELIENNLERTFNLWSEKQEYLKPLTDHLLGIIYNSQLLVQSFLSLTQALEGYHRRRIGGQYFSKEEYRPFQEALEATIAGFELAESERQKELDDMKQSLTKGCVQYGYQYSFLKRIKELWSALEPEIQAYFNIDNPYLVTIKDTRNYYTHYDPEDENKALKDASLNVASTRLAALVLILILRELEIPVQLQLQVLERLKQFRALK